MKISKLTEQLSVCPQVGAEDFKQVAQLGFKSVICNRPAGESDDQPDMAMIEKAALDAGLVWSHQPVVSGKISDQDVADFDALLAAQQGPVFAFCRTGTRCSILWALSQAGKMSTEEILQVTKNAGFDLTAQQLRIEQLAE